MLPCRMSQPNAPISMFQCAGSGMDIHSPAVMPAVVLRVESTLVGDKFVSAPGCVHCRTCSIKVRQFWISFGGLCKTIVGHVESAV